MIVHNIRDFEIRQLLTIAVMWGQEHPNADREEADEFVYNFDINDMLGIEDTKANDN